MTQLPIKVKEQAIKLRNSGYSVKEIANKLGIAKSTSSLWVREIKLNKKAQYRLQKRHLLPYYKSAIRWKRIRQDRDNLINLEAKRIIHRLNRDNNIKKIYCSLLYWCEGGKGYYDSLRFVNSDPALVKTFLTLLRDGFQIDEKRLRILMHLHSYHNEQVQQQFWSQITKIPRTQFNKTFRKPNTHHRIRNNYPGCVSISYHDCNLARLVRAIYKVFSEQIGA